MKRAKLIFATFTLLLVFGMAADSFADISNAAVLFLRIAPGSRAAAMGEAYVAVADDATATHWNPAGLGNYPLSSTWITSDVPGRFRPIRAIAPVSTGSEDNYLDYDIWAISQAGLIRYNNKGWFTGEVFSTRTDETVVGKTRNYFNVTDDAKLAVIVDKVAAANNRGTLADLEELRTRIVSHLPGDYDRRQEVLDNLDSLVAAYPQCRVNWDRTDEARDRLNEALRDSVMSKDDLERLAASLNRSSNRFLPEDLEIPYSAVFAGELTCMVPIGKQLIVGSTDGLARYTGESWQLYTTADGLPSNNITALHAIGPLILIGTDSGLAQYDRTIIKPITAEEQNLPAGPVQAIGGTFTSDLYVVVNNELYHYNSHTWSNDFAYTVSIGDSLGTLADKFSLYKNAVDRDRFVEKYKAMYKSLIGHAADIAVPAAETSDSTMDSTTVTTPSNAFEGIPGVDAPLKPGEIIRVPYAASIKGEVNALFVDFRQRIWLGTEYGVFSFDGQRWQNFGYKNYTMLEGETLNDLVSRRAGLSADEAAAYRTALLELNDLTDGVEPSLGESLWIYSHPGALPVHSFGSTGDRLLVATDGGLLEYDGALWSRAEVQSASQDKVIGMVMLEDNAWIASPDKVVIRGRGHSEISLMHVNWLPELADDLYYEFLSGVTSKDGWGTFGGSVTFISYGKFARTLEGSPEVVGEFESFDVALTASYGTSLTQNLKGGLSVKLIYSRLAEQGAGKEQGKGTSTGFAVDLGMLYLLSSRLTFGAALTNLGPKMSYIDAAQSDDLPRNLAMGFAYKLMQSEYTSVLLTAEANKLMVGLDDGIGTEVKEVIFNAGGEFAYAGLIAFRAGYIYDQEGDIKTVTLGAGLRPIAWGSFDFSYIPSQNNFSLANTLRVSLRIIL